LRRKNPAPLSIGSTATDSAGFCMSVPVAAGQTFVVGQTHDEVSVSDLRGEVRGR